MKTILLFAFFLCTTSVFGQTAYYDALFCASLTPEDCQDLIKSEALSGGDLKVITELEIFLNSPFSTSTRLPDFNRARLIFSQQQANANFALKASGATPIHAAGVFSSLLNFSNLSGSNMDTLLYGVTIYFADGFRREYLQTYMHTFDRTIGKVGELKMLFPTSYAKLRSFDPARYKDLGNEMKQVFDDDLSQVFPNLINHIESAGNGQNFPIGNNYLLLNKVACQKIFATNEYRYVRMTADVGQKLIEGVHPGNIISYLANGYTDYPDGLEDKIQILNHLQEAFRDTASKEGYGNAWISMEKLSKLNTNLKKAYFVAILYGSSPEQAKDFFDLDTEISNLKRDDLILGFTFYDTSFKSKVFSVLNVLSKMDDYKKLKGDNIFTEQNFQPYVMMMADLFATVLLKDLDDRETSITIINSGLKIYNAIRVKNYENVPVYLNTLLTPIVKKIAAEQEVTSMEEYLDPILKNYSTGNLSYRTFKKLTDSVYKKDAVIAGYLKKTAKLLYKDSNTTYSVKAIQEHFTKNKKNLIELKAKTLDNSFADLSRKIDKVSAFTAGVVNAKTSEDVSVLIKQFAAPSTTATDKRNTRFSITVSGMPGLYMGMNRFVGSQLPDSVRNGNSFKGTTGISLPIGLDFSFSLASRKKLIAGNSRSCSLGLFASIVDLGAMLNYRITTNSSVLPETVAWQSILSPGLTLVLGFPNTPLTIGLGYQYAPKLRKFKEIENGAENVASASANTHLWQLRLAYDLPVFRLYNNR